MDAILLFPVLISFCAVLFILPRWIGKAKKIGLVWEDMNKFNRPKNIAGSGGLIVILGFILGVLFYIFLKTFYFDNPIQVVEIFALTTSVLILAVIGLVDDLLGWWHGGLSKKFRLFLCIFAAIPLMVINAGNSYVSIPFLDGTNLGLMYALIIIPLGIVGTSTTFNFLAGYNGLEAGQGILILGALSIVAYLTGQAWLALIGLCLVFALIAFLFFNRFPAKVFPGDVLTYPVGGMIAIIAIFGNIEQIAIFFFVPYILEVFLKTRGGLKKQSFGKPNKDGSLEMKYNKIYGLEHMAIWFLRKVRGRATEKEVVYMIYAFQIVVIVTGLLIFRENIF
ncbi:MAG: glycosyl transferase family 4 [Nanoarchaeota archaeon]|nr:glycosyl transferase family 4 [Nanoarchaeota archaeon]MBU4086037.1 glycosyl transferase family 4 [Nanoarchaeota archaeon]